VRTDLRELGVEPERLAAVVVAPEPARAECGPPPEVRGRIAQLGKERLEQPLLKALLLALRLLADDERDHGERQRLQRSSALAGYAARAAQARAPRFREGGRGDARLLLCRRRVVDGRQTVQEVVVAGLLYLLLPPPLSVQ